MNRVTVTPMSLLMEVVATAMPRLKFGPARILAIIKP